MEPEGLLPCFQEPATGPNPVPGIFSQQFFTLFPF
jgi:hypothetical protein